MFYIVGLPICRESVTQGFLDFIHSDVETLCLSTAWIDVEHPSLDYLSAQEGYDRLLEHFTLVDRYPSARKAVLSLPLWQKEGKRRNKQDVSNDVGNIINFCQRKWPSVRLAYITPGSPLLYNVIVPRLLTEYETLVIDTKSSAALVYETLLDHTEGLPCHVVDADRLDFVANAFNVIGCISDVYDDPAILLNRLAAYNPETEVYAVQIGRERSVVELRLGDLASSPYLSHRSFPTTLGFRL